MAPDSGRLEYWHAHLADGTSRSSVVVGIVYSSEYCVDFVNDHYYFMLGRAADPSGLPY